MKYVKLIALSALAISAVMASLATWASASGKTCSTAATTHSPLTSCGGGHGNVYQGKIIASSVGNVILHVYNDTAHTSLKGKVTCTASSASGQITNGTTGTGKIESQTFTGCTSPELCPSVEIHTKTSATAAAPWAATGTKSGFGDGNGTLDVTGPTGTFTCTFFGLPISCNYGSSQASVVFDGSDAGPLMTAAVRLNKESGPESTCGVSATWTGTYKVTTPVSLWIT